jgi:hypothetical protein
MVRRLTAGGGSQLRTRLWNPDFNAGKKPPATPIHPILPPIKEKGAGPMALGTPSSARDALVTPPASSSSGRSGSGEMDPFLAVGLSKRLLLRLFFSNAGIAAAADFAVYQRKRRLD